MWREYTFLFKPSRVNKSPPFVPFHLPALDWRLWFLPLEAARGGEPPVWFMRVLVRLLECEPTVMELFEHCPFTADDPPRFMRALLYDYRFRFQYEKEEEIKQLVREFKIPDTNIVTQSDDEEQLVESEAEGGESGENGEEEEEEEGQQEPNELEQEPVYVESEPEPDTAAATEESSDASSSVQKPPLRRSRSAGAAEAAQEVLDRLARQHAKKQQPDPVSPHKSSHHSYGLQQPPSMTLDSPSIASPAPSSSASSDADAAFRRALRAKQQKLIREMLASIAKENAASSSKRSAAAAAKKSLHPPPPEFDEQCERVWWVRRHLIGSYGPILAIRPKPATAVTEEQKEAWEQALEE